MKRLIMIGGTMGVGKTSTGKALSDLLPSCAFLDGDWCWTYRPECMNEETKTLVIDNIVHMLRGYLRSTTYQNVVFVWVMHQSAIWESILSRLQDEEYDLYRFALVSSRRTFEERFLQDVNAGIRRAEDLEGAYARMALYPEMNIPLIGTDDLGIIDAAKQILSRIEDKK